MAASHGEKFESSQISSYFQKITKEPQVIAFLMPTMAKYFKSEIPGKKVLDIGCGSGHWSYQAAEHGAKSVDGFDIQEELVELAKRANSKFTSVKIQVGDIMCMPYDDNVFDVAVGFHIVCALRLEACTKLFRELYRVLAPGGKAMLVTHSKPVFEKLFMRSGTDKTAVEEKITTVLKNLKQHPSQNEIYDALKSLDEVIEGIFTLDEYGYLQRVCDVSKMTIGKALWAKTQVITFPNNFYDDHFIQQQSNAAGLNIDRIENYYTEERRIAYNNTNPEIKLDKDITDTPPLVMYHLSKPVN